MFEFGVTGAFGWMLCAFRTVGSDRGIALLFAFIRLSVCIAGRLERGFIRPFRSIFGDWGFFCFAYGGRYKLLGGWVTDVTTREGHENIWYVVKSLSGEFLRLFSWAGVVCVGRWKKRTTDDW